MNSKTLKQRADISRMEVNGMSVILAVFFLVGCSNGDETSTTKSTFADPINDEADCCFHKSAHHKGIIYIYPLVSSTTAVSLFPT